MAYNFDGSGKPELHPYDAHERVVRESHSHSQEAGYQPAEYEHQEYPKHVVCGQDEDGNDVVKVFHSREEEDAASQKAGE